MRILRLMVLFASLILFELFYPEIFCLAAEEIPDKVPAGTEVLVGSTITIEGVMEEDCTVVGYNISALGVTRGDQLIAGRQVDVRGVCEKDIRIMGGIINIGGIVDGNASALGGSINVGRSARIAGNLLALGGYADIEGTVDGSVRVLGGTVTVGGDIGGDIYIEGGRILLKPGARLQGSVVCSSPKEALIVEGAEVSGGIRYLPPHFWARAINFVQYGFGGLSFYFISKVLGFFSLLVLGFFLLYCFPVFTGAAAGHIAGDLKAAVGGGICCLILLPLLALVFLVTVAGIPLGIVIIAGYLILIIISKVTVCLWLGQTLTRGWDEHRTVPFIMGAVIISALTAIPVLGPIIWAAAAALGAGGIFAAYRSGVHLPVSKERAEG